jgi:nucleoside-diphosphate-sugar epimerase
MKVLVTGGAGFIGSHLTERLLENGHQAIVLDDLSTGLESNVPSSAELVLGDAGDADLLQKILPGCDGIFHLAAVSSVQDSLDRPLDVHHTNLTMTLRLLEACRNYGVKKFIFSSSAAVYGDTGGHAAREDMKPCPLSHYAVQKLASEYYCDVYRRLYGIEAICLRYFNIFGPRQRADSPYSGVIARFIDRAKKGQPITIYGDGSQTRDFCPVSNVVNANIAASKLNLDGVAQGVFNIGTGCPTSVRDLATAVRDFYPSTPEVVIAPARIGEIHASVADISEARKNLGCQPTHSFKNAIQELVQYYSVN